MTKQTRQYLSGCLLGVVLDAVLSVIIAVTAVREDEWIVFAVGVFVFLQIAPLLFSGKSLLYQWVSYKLASAKAVSGIAMLMVEQGYPAPVSDDQSAQHFLDRIARNTSLSDKVRMDAAVDLGTLKAPSTLGHWSTAMRINAIYDDAVLLLRQRKAGV